MSTVTDPRVYGPPSVGMVALAVVGGLAFLYTVVMLFFGIVRGTYTMWVACGPERPDYDYRPTSTGVTGRKRKVIVIYPLRSRPYRRSADEDLGRWADDGGRVV